MVDSLSLCLGAKSSRTCSAVADPRRQMLDMMACSRSVNGFRNAALIRLIIN
jgi:hypothetical protein